jgi:hypothetical protein
MTFDHPEGLVITGGDQPDAVDDQDEQEYARST